MRQKPFILLSALVGLGISAASVQAGPRDDRREDRREAREGRREVKESRREVKEARRDVRRAKTPKEKRDAREELREEREEFRNERADERRDRTEDRRDNPNTRYNSNNRYNGRNTNGRWNRGTTDQNVTRTVEGVVVADSRGNTFTLRLSSGQQIRVQAVGGEPRRLDRGDRVRVSGILRNGFLRAQTLRIIRNR